MRRLEHRGVLADVGTGRDAETADHARGEVGQDVAVQVGQHEHVPLVRPLDETHAGRVDEVLPGIDVRVLLGDLAEDRQEQPIGVLHDVGLRHAVDPLAPVVARVFERVADDALGAELAHRLDRDAGALADLLVLQAVEVRDDLVGLLRVGGVLDAGVQVLGVLADDDDVDVVEARPYAGVGLARAQAGVEVELVAQRHVDRAEPGADRRGDRALDGDTVATDRVDRLLRERSAGRLHDVNAGFLHIPVERRSDGAGRGLEYSPSCLGQFGPGAITGNEGHAVRGHNNSPGLVDPPARLSEPGRPLFRPSFQPLDPANGVTAASTAMATASAASTTTSACLPRTTRDPAARGRNSNRNAAAAANPAAMT